MTKPNGERLALVVERQGAARELEEQFLRSLGMHVELACDGLSAWDATQRFHPDLVIAEILIPRLDGLALCRQIKASPETRDIRVLIVSMLAATARAREAGADGFLMKPILEDRFTGAVARLLPVHAALRQEKR